MLLVVDDRHIPDLQSNLYQSLVMNLRTCFSRERGDVVKVDIPG